MNNLKVGCILMAALIMLGALAPVIAPADPLRVNMSERLQSVSLEHPMGTDQLGRDLFSRILYAARTSFSATFTVMLSCMLIGTTIGCVAGTCGGLADELLMRLVDMLMAFPSFILPIAITGILGSSVANIVMALTLTTWTGYARMVRGSVLAVKEQAYVEATVAMGGSRRQVIRDHIIPNAIYPLLVYAALHAGHVLLSIAGLSFIGLGAQPPTPEWGAMLNEATSFLGSNPHLFIFPGGAIMLTVLAFNLVGEGLRDLMDPKLQKEVEI